ncbi:hypothetical protein [Streptomyces sp. NBC_01264]|uniref:hypothetical protein n=1 Tax=Streptomyces sp. NBC_01264 TaxID=2903804 RepID=UPI00225C3773|nr:hypothetical protein [Streptomyces sp. NBC_01264]MCX4778121.1 hypothetical protein [Streptomyces sp. NBC_01264]
MTTKPLPPHGTLSRSKNYGCKCWDCCEVLRAYNRDRYAAMTAGTWHPFVDAEPIRQHLLELAAVGITSTRITELTGLPHRTVAGFLRHQGTKPRKRSATPETAAKILAVKAVQDNAAKIASTGTQRRIQALVAIGWPMQVLAPHLGLKPKYVADVFNRDFVMSRTAEATRYAYESLGGLRPERQGVRPASAKHARALAAERRWAPPRYWNQRPGAIDDPHFTPEYGMKKADLLAEEATFLVTVAGLTRTQAAERLGKDRSYVDRVLSQQLAA